MLLLEPVDGIVAQGWNLAVLSWAQARQPRLAGVHDEHAAAGSRNHSDEPSQVLITIMVVNADSALDGHRHRYCCLHRQITCSNPLRFRHEAGTETARLHPLGGAANIDVDFAVTGLFTETRAARHLLGIAAAELQGQWLLFRVVSQQVAAIAVQ